MAKRPPGWKIVQDVNHKKFSTGGVIAVENNDDVIHFDKSSTLALSTSLDDLDFATLNIDGQSMDVDAPPDIIDVDEDDDSIDYEDALPHDLADSDDEDLANDDDDDDVVATVSEARAPENPTGEAEKPADSILAGKPGPSGYERLQINGARRRSCLSGTIEARSCLSVTTRLIRVTSSGRSSGSSRCTTLLGTRSRRSGRRGSLEKLVQIGMCSLPFCLIPRTLPGVLKMLKTVQRARSYTGGDPAITCCPPRYAESSDTREYPSLIQTYFDTHTVDGVFLRDNERLLYKEILRLQGLGLNTPMGVPYTDDEIMTIVCRGKKRWHLPDVGRLQSQNDVGSGNKSGKGRDDEDAEEDKDKDEDANEDEDADGDAES
ncbi:hypothetical protein Tco_0673675 [Tanacetum coccineum]